MIAVAIVAVPLAGLQSFSGDWRAAVLSVAFACLAWIGAEWLNFRGKRALAAICFGGIAALFNVLYPAVCICPDSYLLIALWLAWFFMIAPLLIAFGAAWARLATAKSAMSEAFAGSRVAPGSRSHITRRWSRSRHSGHCVSAFSLPGRQWIVWPIRPQPASHSAGRDGSVCSGWPTRGWILQRAMWRFSMSQTPVIRRDLCGKGIHHSVLAARV